MLSGHVVTGGVRQLGHADTRAANSRLLNSRLLAKAQESNVLWPSADVRSLRRR